MARTRSRTALAPRRSGGAMVSKSRFTELKQRATAARKRLRDANQDDVNSVVGVASAIGLALYEKDGRSLPTLFGIDPAITWGAGAYLLGRTSKSKGMQLLRSAGLAWVTVGANRSAVRGSMMSA